MFGDGIGDNIGDCIGESDSGIKLFEGMLGDRNGVCIGGNEFNGVNMFLLTTVEIIFPFDSFISLDSTFDESRITLLF